MREHEACRCLGEVLRNDRLVTAAASPKLLTCAGLAPDIAAGLNLDQLATPRARECAWRRTA